MYTDLHYEHMNTSKKAIGKETFFSSLFHRRTNIQSERAISHVPWGKRCTYVFLYGAVLHPERKNRKRSCVFLSCIDWIPTRFTIVHHYYNHRCCSRTRFYYLQHSFLSLWSHLHSISLLCLHKWTVQNITLRKSCIFMYVFVTLGLHSGSERWWLYTCQ